MQVARGEVDAGEAPPPEAEVGDAADSARADVGFGLHRLLLGIGILTGLWITRHGLQAEMPAGLDTPGHVVMNDFAVRELFGHWRVDGWFPGFGSGYRLFGVNGPGLAIAVGLVRALTLGTQTTAEALAFLGVWSIAVLPCAVAFLSRTLGASRYAAALHGVLALFISYGGGGGLSALYGTGLVSQSVALPLQVVVLACIVRAVRRGGPRNVAVAALLLGILALLHPISILMLGAFAPLLLVLEWVRAPRQSLARFGLVLVGGIGVAGFWLVPALQGRDRRGGMTGWAIPPFPTRLADIFRGDALVPRLVALAATAALVVTLLQALAAPALRYRLLAPATGLVFLTVTHYGVGHGWEPRDFLLLAPTRGLALASILLLQPLAEVLGDLVGLLRRVRLPRLGRARLHLGFRGLSVGVFVAVALAVPGLLSGPLDPPQRAHVPATDLQAAATQLPRLVPPMGRHLLVPPSPFVNLGTDTPARWLAATSGTNSAHLYIWESTEENAAGVLASDLVVNISPGNATAALRRLAVTHVVVTSLDQAAQFDALADSFRLVWRQGEVSIFEVQPARQSPSPGALLQPDDGARTGRAGLEATPVTQESQRLAWETRAGRPVEVVAAVAYDPAWEATVDGESVPVERSADGLVKLTVPEGRHTLALRFPAQRGLGPGGLLTVLSLGTIVLALSPRARARLRRRRPRVRSASSGPNEGSGGGEGDRHALVAGDEVGLPPGEL